MSASNQCGTSCTPTAPFYSISGSSTSKTNGQPVKLSYGTGSASGTVVSDTMSMSGFTATQVGSLFSSLLFIVFLGKWENTWFLFSQVTIDSRFFLFVVFFLLLFVLIFFSFTYEQAFAACNDISDLTSSSDQNGLLGLGWQSLCKLNFSLFPFSKNKLDSNIRVWF